VINQSKHICIAPCVANESEVHVMFSAACTIPYSVFVIALLSSHFLRNV